MKNRTARLKNRIARILYRYPQLYHMVRPLWVRTRWIVDRTIFLLTPHAMWQRFLPEEPILVDLQRIKGIGAPPPNGVGAGHSYAPPPTLSAEVVSWLRAVVASDDYRTSLHFHETVNRLAHGEIFHGITSAQELAQEVDMIRSPSDTQPIEVWLTADGGIVVSRGILRVLNTAAQGGRSVKANVIWRHPQWQRVRQELAFSIKTTGKLYQKVLHPDLDLLPASRICEDRIEVVRPHLPRQLKTVLDLGASFGSFSRWLEDEGYEVTAVEDDPIAIHYLNLLRSTLGYGFKIFPHDVREFVPAKPIDILWAMSVLHGFTKTEPDHASLVRLLRHLSPKVIFFEPPRGNEYTDRGRFRIYQPDEFAELVCKSAQLQDIRQLGESETGRPIYLIQ
jgi:Methyltransferase domain